MSAAPCKFGDFELDIPGFQLRNGSGPVKLERIPLELLIFLIEQRGQLVSREDIAAHLWSDGVHIDIESGVNTAIRKLRSALNDSPDKPAFVETVPGKGYRFIGAVVEPDRPRTTPVPPSAKRLWQPAVLVAGLATVLVTTYYARTPAARPAVPISPVTVVVLPFQNLSSDPEQDYFSEGLTEETIAALGSVTPAHVRVIGRTSSMAYRGTRKTAAEIGKELGVGYLVESTVRRDVQRVRITTKLIRAQDQVQVWGHSYDLTPSGLLEVQQRIGTAIARDVGGELSPRSGAARTLTQDPDAHDLYLRGRYYGSQRTPESVRKSVEYFEAALQKDPSYALAHAALADTYIIQAVVTWANPRDQWKKAETAIQKALRLDPNLAEAHTAAAMVSFFMAWDWPAAERSFRRAIELNPNYAIARQFYAHFLSNSRRPDEAIAEIQKAREIDPLSSMTHVIAGGVLVMARRYGQAPQPLQHALAIDPDFFPTHSVLGLLYQQTGKPDAAIEEYRKAYRLSRGNIVQLAYQGFVLGQTGHRREAEQIISTMKQIAQTRFVPPFAFALVYTGLGNRDAAFQWLEKAYEARDLGMVFLLVDPKWDSIRSDKRFQDLLRRCRFLV